MAHAFSNLCFSLANFMWKFLHFYLFHLSLFQFKMFPNIFQVHFIIIRYKKTISN